MSSCLRSSNMVANLIKMAKGNSRSLAILASIWTLNPMAVIWLDLLDVHGSRIWKLYKKVCHSNIQATIGILYAVQQQTIAPEVVRNAVLGYVHFTEQQLNEFAALCNSIELD